MCSSLGIQSCPVFPSSILPCPISLYLHVLHPIVNLPISLFMNYLPITLIELLWSDRCFVYYHIEISKILWENCCCLYFSVESMEAQEKICDMLTLSKLASGRGMWLKDSCSPWLFHLTFPLLPEAAQLAASPSFHLGHCSISLPKWGHLILFYFLLIFDFFWSIVAL